MLNRGMHARYLSRLRHGIWMFLGRYPQLLPLFRVYKTITKRKLGIVGRDTDVVIEGYPRSANTFALVAFQLAQPRPLHIAHHIHGPAQIIQGIQYNIPTILLIREPAEAVTSLLVRSPFLRPMAAIENYIRFYTRALPYKGVCIVGEFHEVVHDYGAIIARLNAHCHTHFQKFEHTEDNLRRCDELIEQMDRHDTGDDKVLESTVARPSQQRALQKAEIRQMLTDKGYKPLLKQAQSIYDQIIRNR